MPEKNSTLDNFFYSKLKFIFSRKFKFRKNTCQNFLRFSNNFCFFYILIRNFSTGSAVFYANDNQEASAAEIRDFGPCNDKKKKRKKKFFIDSIYNLREKNLNVACKKNKALKKRKGLTF